MGSRNPLCWISLEPGLWVFWKHGNAWPGSCLASKGRLDNAGAVCSPQIPPLRQGGYKCPRPGRIRQFTYPEPRPEWQHANSPLWDSWGVGYRASGQRLGGRPEGWPYHKAEVQVSPWLLPASASAYHLGIEVGGREEEEDWER